MSGANLFSLEENTEKKIQINVLFFFKTMGMA